MIDWTRVQQLKDEIGASDFEEIVVLFLEEVEEVVERLKTSLDLSVIGEDLHFLKGSALNLGFERFASMCQNGEALAKTNKVDAPMVAEIIECYSESRKLFLDGAKNPVQKAG